MRHAKIVCTLGPATKGYDNIRRLIEVGMDVARLNFSHGDHARHREAFDDVRRASAELGKPVAILADLSGPKIRLGDLKGGVMAIEKGAALTLTSRQGVGGTGVVSTNFPQLPQEVAVGMPLFIDDGMLEFVIRRVTAEDVVCEARSSGILRSRKGINVPAAGASLPALTNKDREDIAFGRELGVDYFALSFVRRPEDVVEARALAGGIPIIAKIEKPSAVERLEEIADVADGLMVARGDLGIEIGFEKVPLIQKRIIKAMNRRAKPVITATHMLESMVHNLQPTRAEVSDVANAILDGTDAVMLSAETAAGAHPFLAVQTMVRTIREVEAESFATGTIVPPSKVAAPSFQNAVAHAAARAAIDLKLKAVAVYSESGRSAALVSAYRPSTEIVGFSRHQNVLHRMALYWGVRPMFGHWADNMKDLVAQTEQKLLAHGLAEPGDAIAITFGLAGGDPAGTTILKLWHVRPQES